MAISRIRGEQIRPGVLVNQHIADNAGIHESKLDINWLSHYAQALETKKVIDFVQVGNKVVGGLSSYNLSTQGILAGNAPKATSVSTDEGVIIDAPYNKVIIRDSVTGDSILDVSGNEVYGRMVHDGVDFIVMFYTSNDETETPFTMPENQEIDFQYMERFNLRTVSELFAANEKFVAGAADITAFQNIHQLAKDIYGAGYTLDRDGQGNLSVSLVDQIANEVQERQQAIQDFRNDLLAQATAGKGANLIGIEDAGNRFLGGTVEAVLAEIKDALDELKNDLASTALGKGASMIGLHDAAGKFNASDVEGALAELADRASSLEQGSNLEVDNAKSRDAASANGYFAQKTFASLENRLVEIETVVDSEVKGHGDRLDAIEAEIQAARNGQVSLDARLDAMQAEIDAEEDARAQGDQEIRDDFASTDAGKGASLIGVHDANGKLTAINVEGALIELADRSTAVEGRATNLENEVQAARGSASSLDVRLDRALNEDGTLKAGRDIHKHYRARYQATGGESQVTLDQFNKTDLPNFQVGDDSLEVYINGQLQEVGLNYLEGADGRTIIFDIGDGTVLQSTDIVQIKYYVNNPE